MELKFRVAARIAKPVHEVFEAVADPAQLSEYFTTGGAKGRLETGATVTGDFHDFPGAFPVHGIEVVPDGRIILERTEERLGGKEWIMTFRLRWLADHYKKKTINTKRINAEVSI